MVIYGGGVMLLVHGLSSLFLSTTCMHKHTLTLSLEVRVSG